MKKLLTSALAALLLSPGAQAATVPASGHLSFSVVRKGSHIGTYKLGFTQSGKTLKVSIKTHVNVKMLLISVYHFNQQSTEIWQGGKLASLQTATDDNGKKSHISIGASPLIPASLWDVDMLRARTVLNTITGKPMRIRVASLGAQTVQTGSGAVATKHYRVSGDLARDLWYDAGGNLVKVAMKGNDGSLVSYIRK